MKKEYIDALYAHRSKCQNEIDSLVERDKQPKDGTCDGCGDPIRSELEAKRGHIFSINRLIELYLEIH